MFSIYTFKHRLKNDNLFRILGENVIFICIDIFARVHFEIVLKRGQDFCSDFVYSCREGTFVRVKSSCGNKKLLCGR